MTDKTQPQPWDEEQQKVNEVAAKIETGKKRRDELKAEIATLVTTLRTLKVEFTARCNTVKALQHAAEERKPRSDRKQLDIRDAGVQVESAVSVPGADVKGEPSQE